MGHRPLKRATDHTILHAESFESTVEQLLAAADAAARQLREEYPDQQLGDDDDHVPRGSTLLEEGLRRILEDEITPAVTTDDGGINDTERNQELMKKALIGLKAAVLRDIAVGRGLPKSGNGEAIATRIAQSYDWDADAIARLVLDNTGGPRATEHGHSTRVFVFRDSPELVRVKDRVSYVGGRYIRTGVARWFVFRTIVESDDKVELQGSFESYRTSVAEDEDGQAALNPTPSSDGVSVEIAGRRTFVVHNGSVTASRSTARAVQIALDSEVLDYVPGAESGSSRTRSTQFHAAAEFMLDVLYNRLRTGYLRELNLIIARFKLSDRPEASTATRAPSLRAVRFEGDHLLDNVNACRLLARDGRALVDVSFVCRVQSSADGTAGSRFPVRVAIDTDHVLVETGLGTENYQQSLDVHRFAVEAVRTEVEGGIANADRLSELFAKVVARAEQRDAPTEADMFADADDSSPT